MISNDTRRLLVPALVASALVLAGILATRLGAHTVATPAQAGMTSQTAGFTLVTGNISNDEEGLFVIDNANGVLLVYGLTNRQDEMRLINGLLLQNLFAASAGGQEELEGVGESDDSGRDRRPNNGGRVLRPGSDR